MWTLNVSEFKAKCLAVLAQVARTDREVTILKRGKPIARLLPPVHCKARYPQDELHGTVEILGEIMGPVVPPEAWHANERGHKK